MLNYITKHKIAFAVIIIILLIATLLPLASYRHVYKKSELSYGVTFSPKIVKDMGLNWQKAYLEILDDLKVRKLRLAAYWDEIEKKRDVYYFEDLDWQVREAAKRNVEIILAVGYRLPRWPECHQPEWSESIEEGEKKEEILSFLKLVIERYRENKNIIAWQIENEPFLPHFGDCPRLDKEFLDKEISRARSLDERPIVITDSGELSVWVLAAKRADIFGTSIYRDTYSHFLNRYIHYPITPGFFRLKANLTEFFTNPKPEKMIVIELQAEPWGPNPYYNLTKTERERTMNLDKFKEILEYSRQAGFREFYLWGAEWWYWEKEVGNDDILWEFAKELF